VGAMGSLEVFSDTVSVTFPIGVYVVPVQYEQVVKFVALVIALCFVVFLEVLLGEKDQRLQVTVKFGLWFVVAAVLWISGNYGVGYMWVELYLVFSFWLELAGTLRSVV